MINSRKYLNDRLMQTAISRSPNAPAVTNPDSLASAHAANQAQTRAGMESAEKSLGLKEQQLDFANRQARDNLNFRRDDFNTGKSITNQANIVNTLGLGVNAYGAYKQMKNADETMTIINKYIDSQNAWNDQTKDFFRILMERRTAYK